MVYWSHLLRTWTSHLMGKAFQKQSFLEFDDCFRHLVIVRRCTTQQIERHSTGADGLSGRLLTLTSVTKQVEME